MAELIDGVEYLDVDEASGMLGVKRATLYAYVSRGVLRSFRQGVGRRRLYLRAEVERLRAVRPDEPRPAPQGQPEPQPWLALPDEEAGPGGHALPDVASWAGDH